MRSVTTTRLDLVLVLGFLTALAPLSIDLYLPAFPVLQRDLGAGDASVQFTLAGMTLGLAAGQAVIGAWSDRVGRRAPLLLATGLHVLTTLGCALAPTVELLAALRVVQGIGAAGSAVLVLAIIRDLAEGPDLVVLLSRVTLVTTATPLLAPVAGAELLPLVGWRGIFVVLALASAAVLVATVAIVPETRPAVVLPVPLRTRLRSVWADASFRRGTAVSAMTYAGVYAYVAASPLLLQGVYGLSSRAFALVFLVNSLGLLVGVQLASRLARRYGTSHVLIGFIALSVLSAAGILPTQWAGFGLAGLLSCLWLFVLACGGCFPCSAAIALADQGEQSGTATSVNGFASFAVAGLVSPAAGLIGIGDAAPVALVLLGTSVVSLAGALAVGRRAESPRRAGGAERTMGVRPELGGSRWEG